MNEIAAPHRANLPDDHDGTEPETAPASEVAPPRRRVSAGWVAGLVLTAVFIVGTIGPPLFGRGVFLASDLLYSTYPWAPSASDHLNYGDSGSVSDTVDGAYPIKSSFGTALRDGEWQTWTPLVTGGTPLAPTMSGVLSPFALSYVVFPSWFAPAMEKLLQLVASIGFTYLFCRRLGTERGPALFAGIAFAGSGFMVMWSNWDQPNVAAWIPALFWGTELFLQTRTLRSLALISVALAAMLLGLFPTVVFYSLYILGPYVAVRLLAERDWSWLRRVVSGLGIGAGLAGGIGLAAITLLPFMARLGDQNLAYRAQGPDNHLHLANLITTVAPTAIGLSTEGPNQGYFGGNQVEGLSYLGMSTVVLALVCLALRAPRRMPVGVRGVLGGATLVFVAATYNGGSLLGLLQNLPAFDNSYVGRTRAVLGFIVAVLAGLGLQALVERRWPQTAWHWARAGVVGVGAAVGAVAVLRAVRDIMPPAPHVTNVRGAFVLPALVLVGVAGAAWVLRSGRAAARPWAVGAIVTLLVVESLAFAVPMLPNESRDSLYPTTPGIEFLQDNIGTARYEGDGRIMYGDATMLFDLPRMGGHTFYPPAWKQLLQAADAKAFGSSPTYPAFRAEVDVAASPVFDRFGTKYWAGTPGTPFGDREATGLAAGSCDRPVDLDADPLTLDLPAGEPVRAVVLNLCEAVAVPADAVLLGQAGSADEGVKQFGAAIAPGELVVPLPEADAADGSSTVTLSLRDADGAELPVAADAAGDVAFDVVRVSEDGLRLAYADDLLIYERENALPRVRWAARSEVVTEVEDRLEKLAGGELDDDTVMLDRAADQAGDGSPASVKVTRDADERIELEVDAEGDGFVVVADSLQTDWVAEVDGREVDLLEADHAGVAVAVGQGTHDVVLRNKPRGHPLGALLSGFTALVLLAVVIGERVWRRRR